MDHYYDDDEDKKGGKAEGKVRYEFECPECNAHNPYDDGFQLGSEILCFYCGMEFKVVATDGRLKLKPT